MSPYEYLQKVGRDEADATARRAKISPGYFNQICYGFRRASVETALKIVKHQHRSGKLTLESMLLFKRKKGARFGPGGRPRKNPQPH